MNIIRTSLLGFLGFGIILLIVFFVSFSFETKIIVLECTPEFWENNLDLWKITGLNPDDNFDEIFGKDYFDPDITLEQAIKKQGVGMNHLARSGTTAYLNALVDPEIDEESIRSAVNFGYVHQIDDYLTNCNEIKVEVPNLSF